MEIEIKTWLEDIKQAILEIDQFGISKRPENQKGCRAKPGNHR
jgi:hypothetical protein